MKNYNTFEEIDHDLKILKLEKDIAWEKLKGVKEEFLEDFKPVNWVTSTAKFAGKYGVFMLAKNIFKKF